MTIAFLQQRLADPTAPPRGAGPSDRPGAAGGTPGPGPHARPGAPDPRAPPPSGTGAAPGADPGPARCIPARTGGPDPPPPPPAPTPHPGPDGGLRCPWALSAPEYLAYHDEEWGRPVRGDTAIFERLCLEGFQSGLSWLTILRKRENFRAAFAGFDLGRRRPLRRRGRRPACWPTRASSATAPRSTR